MTLLMERERKKRRINLNDYNEDNDNDSDNDDVKMEKFFALIRSAKDIRDQLLGIEPTKEEKEKRVTSDTIEEDNLKAAAAAAGVRLQQHQHQHQQETTLVAEDCEKTDLIMVNSDAAGCSRRSGEDNHHHHHHQHHNKTTADHSSNNNVKGGNFLLDLNLSL